MTIIGAEQVRHRLLDRREIALIDVREEGAYADAHPLFAASLPASRLEIEAFDRIPRSSVPIVLYDDGEGLAAPSARRLRELGYTDVALLDGGLSGWRAAGAELFRDVNVPSKAFGELVEARRHTPSVAAGELEAWLREGRDLVVLDARRFEEYQRMSIPGGISVPGGELVLRVADLAPDPKTLVVVNCAGRTRSIIGAQSLVNAGLPNRVAALRNGTIGWTLAGFELDHNAARRHGGVSPAGLARAAAAARRMAEQAGVGTVSRDVAHAWAQDPNRTLYRFDVRTPEEYIEGHVPGFRSAPGGQLVQETDVFAPVRGARIVLADDAGVRAWMTGSWLKQMGWDVSVLEATAGGAGPDSAAAFTTGEALERGFPPARLPPLPLVDEIDAAALHAEMNRGAVTVVDLARSPEYAQGHLPGAVFAIRSRPDDLRRHLGSLDVAASGAVVLTSPDGLLARFAAADLQSAVSRRVRVLRGGTAAWKAGGFALETGTARWVSPPVDVYRRPYEGTDNPPHAMQAYLDWEYGLVDQLERDGTHHFVVL
jgi:rhodanese-related sulfurtransferase